MVKGSKFVNTHASGKGGAIAVYDKSQVFLEDTSFSDCTSTDGGAVYAHVRRQPKMIGDLQAQLQKRHKIRDTERSNWTDLVHVTAFNCNFTSEHTFSVRFESRLSSLPSTLLELSTKRYGGGALHVETAIVQGCRFSKNSAVAGGAIWIHSFGLVVNTIFEDTFANVCGGAIFGGFYSTIHVINSKFTRTSVGFGSKDGMSGARDGGGAIYGNLGSNVWVVSSDFVSCSSAGYGGGGVMVHLYGAVHINQSSFSGCRCVGHEADLADFGGSIFTGAKTKAFLYNNKFAGITQSELQEGDLHSHSPGKGPS